MNIARFLGKNESFVLKEGNQTSVIRPAGKKEVSFMVSGLNPNTKNSAVIRYLEAHGRMNTNDKVIHHVYPGKPGSSLLAGKVNGNRSYMVDIKKPMGSFHIIDGEKVSIRYRGRIKSCARCHKLENDCPGKAVARECTAEQVLLSTHMKLHWANVGYSPESSENDFSDDEDDLEDNVQIGREPHSRDVGSNLTSRYGAVIISGFKSYIEMSSIKPILEANGLPKEFNSEHIARDSKTGKFTISNLSAETCLLVMERMHGKLFLGQVLP